MGSRFYSNLFASWFFSCRYFAIFFILLFCRFVCFVTALFRYFMIVLFPAQTTRRRFSAGTSSLYKAGMAPENRGEKRLSGGTLATPSRPSKEAVRRASKEATRKDLRERALEKRKSNENAGIPAIGSHGRSQSLSKGIPCPYPLCDKHYRRKELLAYHIKNDHGNVWPEDEVCLPVKGKFGEPASGAAGGPKVPSPVKKAGIPTKEEIMGPEPVVVKTSAPEDNPVQQKRSSAPTLKERIAALKSSQSSGEFGGNQLFKPAEKEPEPISQVSAINDLIDLEEKLKEFKDEDAAKKVSFFPFFLHLLLLFPTSVPSFLPSFRHSCLPFILHFRPSFPFILSSFPSFLPFFLPSIISYLPSGRGRRHESGRRDRQNEGSRGRRHRFCGWW